jgi:excisionase family DNA binding protein
MREMAKKYLSLEEAASQLGISADQLKRFREQGDIRGFADRGSWKFREQDIEEFLRTRQTDSSPDFPIITGESSSSVLQEPDFEDLSSSDSDVRLFFDESMFEDDSDAKELANSGSDVQLSGDSGPGLESGPEEVLEFSGWDGDAKISDSDSDVKLVGAGTEAEIDLASTGSLNDSDSDVLLADESELNFSDSDSDVRLSEEVVDNTGEMTFIGSDSDSDVKLMGGDDFLVEDSDSDVKLSAGLDRTDSDIRLADSPSSTNNRTILLPPIPDDSDLKLIPSGSGIRTQGIGSGIGLDADESGISLEMDSGISLEADDSGISLESFDSGAKLGDDSGISLESFDSGVDLSDDSGISLDAGDSGISLEYDDDSGISMQPDDMGRTMPMQAIPGAKAALSDSNAMTTQFDMPAQNYGKDSEFELAGLDDDDDDVGTNTSVLTFEDDEDDASKTVVVPTPTAKTAAPVKSGATAKPSAKKSAPVEDEIEDDLEDSFDDDGGLDDDYSDDENEGVHDAEDFDDEDFEEGQSQVGGFQAPARGGARADVDWGVGIKSLIGFTTLLSVFCAVIGIELIRTMWLWTQPGSTATPSAVLQTIGGLF